MLERREIRPTDVRVTNDSGRPMFEAVVMNYGVLDDYYTIFDPGCFTDSLKARLPRVTRSHDWSDVIGKVVDYKDTDQSLTIIAELDDFDAVPTARRAYAQMKSGTLDQFSVGFARDQVTEDDDGRTHFTRARLDEVAVVLAGAVPDTKLVNVRSRNGVPEDFVISLAKRMTAGELTIAEAQAVIDLFETTTEDRTAKPVHHTPVVDTAWDGNAAMTNAASGADYWAICAWRDPNLDAATRAAYKFPHHSTPGGPANAAGVRNGLARLAQADIPAGDVAGVRNHLQAHLDDYNRALPFEMPASVDRWTA